MLPLASTPAPRVVIADDHPFFRQGLAKLLTEAGLAVVAEVGDGRAAIEAARRHGAEVLVIGLDTRGLPGAEIIRHLAERSLPTRVLVLSSSADEDDVSHAIMAGASGYVLQDDPVEEIVAAIRAAAAGGSLFSPRIAPLVLRRFREGGTAEQCPVLLSKRELDVLRLVADGKANQEIGDALFIEAGTVRNHVSRLLRKLDVDNRVQAAVRAVREHMV